MPHTRHGAVHPCRSRVPHQRTSSALLLTCEDSLKIIEVDVGISIDQELDVVHGRNFGERQVDGELQVVRELRRSFIERCTPKHGKNNGQNLLLVHQREVSEVPLKSIAESRAYRRNPLRQGSESQGS